MSEPSGRALHERFLRGLAISPAGEAVRAGDRSITYEAAHERALRWAGALTSAPAGPPGAVGILADKSVEAYVAVLAALYAGATAVPLHPKFPALRTRRMLDDAQVGAVLADGAGRAALAETGLDLPVLDLAAPAAGPALDAPLPAKPSDVAYMLFTSGSTGRPKGVPITHGSTAHYFDLMDRRYDFGPEDVFSQSVELNFDCAMFELFCPWGVGGSAHAVPARAYLDLPAFLAERRMTVWFSVPSGIGLVRRMGGLAPGSLPSLRWSFFAGEALLCSDAAAWQEAAPNSAVENLYGPTELTITVTRHRWSARSPGLAVNGVVPIGGLHPGHAMLLRADDGASAETEGELCIAGEQMTAGYLNPEDDRGRFLERDGRLWYRTGDRVRLLPGGELAYLGRLDSQVQVQGWRVELAEIDHAVRGFDGVQAAVTTTRPARDGLELVVFYTGTRVPPAGLARRLREVLPAGMIPKDFRHLAEFPLNSNGKVDRPLLAKWAEAQD
ncbi:AMP-binding protein [Actinomadura macrotermitis]|uniref:Tyrocidine synthase 3 n=1 Tax=Actinomadura macrotermitis TaxID=2585200 RepID=A0A7K0C9D1_9ACTN|nr:AMP-binding protein [Actinomadura macrotermitis]MQY09722.1 Tyrocidine synthase 3 [Actinomadura macrotermitis]